MNRGSRRFPLIADDEPVMSPLVKMNLYDNEDLINNIRDFYQEKTYQSMVKSNYEHEEISHPKVIENDPVPPQSFVKKATELSKSRQEAKRSVREKRQAYYAKQEFKAPSKESFQQQLKATVPKKQTQRKVTELSHLSDRLQQESYILAEIPIIFQEPDNTPNPKTKKNNFDFLKRSQVYNKQDNQFHKERAKAQELNLTRFKDIN